MPSLWSPTDWLQRLAELQAPTGELKEAPLRRDVRSLGALLGEVLREQAGESLYQAVEDLRRTAIARRDADATAYDAPNSTDALAALAEQHLQHALTRVQSLTSDTAYQLARAFAFFFELTNLPSLVPYGHLSLTSSRTSLRGFAHHLPSSFFGRGGAASFWSTATATFFVESCRAAVRDVFPDA